MNVKDSTEPTPGLYSIEWGEASWGQGNRSVRNRYDTEDGRFTPHKSSELPIEDLEGLIVESANRDRIPVEQIPQMIGALTGALARHMAGLAKDPWKQDGL